MLFFLFLSCHHQVGGDPHIPAMEAPVYTRVPYTGGHRPQDEGLRSLKLPNQDEVLSGAAGSLALKLAHGMEVDNATLRWSLFRAGWPTPALGWGAWESDPGEAPEELKSALRELSPERSLGLARARSDQGEVWVMIVSDFQPELPAFSRELGLGARLPAGLLSSADRQSLALRTLSPSLREGEAGSPLDEPGEWLLEFQEAAGGARWSVPLYVGISTPDEAPLESVVPLSALDQSGEEEVAELINTLRYLEDAAAARPEPLLHALARSELRGRIEDLPRSLERLGFSGGGLLRCQADSLSACVDEFWWDVDARRKLLDPRVRELGAAWSEQGGSLELVVCLAF